MTLNRKLIQAVDMVWSIADAISEGRHSANVVNWEKVRNELGQLLDEVYKKKRRT